jgi:3-demethoxyubiquinol 3-hydroxylase
MWAKFAPKPCTPAKRWPAKTLPCAPSSMPLAAKNPIIWHGPQSAWNNLNSRPSLLNPIWYAGSFAIGYAAGKLGGDKLSLGFVVETENQVEAHLAEHLSHLPANDMASRAIVAQMKTDEAAHARMAQKSGALELPEPVKRLMGASAKVMTTVAHHI